MMKYLINAIIRQKSLFLLAISSLYLSLSFSSCGYKMGFGEISESYHKVFVPFAENDSTGAFTAQLIRTLSASGAFIYEGCKPDLILKTRILEYYDENIGFRYDQNKQGELEKTLVPSETRRFIKVEVVLVVASTGCPLLGPDILRTSVDFDHEFNSSRDAVNVFSLGQVTDIDGAIDAAARPLNEKMAQMIINYISNAW